MKHTNEYLVNKDFKEQLDSEILQPLIDCGYQVLDSGSLSTNDPEFNTGLHLIILKPIDEEFPGIEEVIWEIEEEEFEFDLKITQYFDLIYITIIYYA